MEQEQIIEGPYWDYVAVSNWAWSQRDTFARLAARHLCVGDTARALVYAGKFGEWEAVCNRITARFDATDNDRSLTFIGWRSASDVRY